MATSADNKFMLKFAFSVAAVIFLAAQCRKDDSQLVKNIEHDLNQYMKKCQAIAEEQDPSLDSEYEQIFKDCMNQKYEWSN